ncbi:hypothetical protein BLA60_20870 [Actinophytocola xinjiangensis]|uniref:GGDEF domain-containing protein n=1 Tax=Actinophytocola xinjiangensis TaxID=485602 RepID=A0A7Z1AYD6_9PSEU|nr:MFS transporter [Actinophytocola xinjiangensis]OLF09042.1 hypothetical protein BLA60_20870 [Actinophytocola xinjiangensis]
MARQARFRAVLAVREFRALWVAELLSIFGDQLARVALAVLVFRETDSAGLTALTYAFTYLPALLGGALLSGLADRYPRRELMVVVDLFRAIAAAAMALPVLPLPVLMGLVFVLALAGGPFKAAQQALLPTVLEGDLYVSGLALRTVTNQSAQLAGFLGGGALLVVLDPYLALGLNAATFLVATVVVWVGVRHRPAARASAPDDDPDSQGTRAALRLIWRDRHLRWLVGVSWLVGLYVVPEGLAAPYAASLGASTIVVGLLLAADPIGSIVGAWLVGRIPEKASTALITPFAVAAGIPLAVCVIRPDVAVSVALWAVSGAFSTAYLILAQASFTRRVPDHRRAAAVGIASTGLLTSQGLAMLAAGGLAELTDPPTAIAIAGAAGALLSWLMGASWRDPHADEPAAADDIADDTAADTDDGARDGARDDDGIDPGIDGATTHPDITSPYPSSSAPPLDGPAAERGSGGATPTIVTRRPLLTLPEVSTAPAIAPSRWPRGWPLWRAPGRALAFIVAVDVAAVGVTAYIGLGTGITAGALTVFAVIVVLGLVVAELTREVERVRRRFNDSPHVNFTSVWVIPAGVLLPPILVTSVVAVLYLHLFWRSWYRVRGVHAYRLIFSAMSMILAAHTVGMITNGINTTEMAQWSELATVGTVLAALLAFAVVNSGLVGAAICLYEGRLDLRRAYGSGRENALELGTLGLGAITTLLFVAYPAWPVLMVPALLVLHRSVLLRQLEEAAATDPKTGLTNATAWANVATREIERARGGDTVVGVLMIDLDHFKSVNDAHGHVVGDHVLKTLAETLSRSVRRDDLVGRWGGEEFVVLCPQTTEEDLVGLGERLCALIRTLRIPVAVPGHAGIIDGLTVSIGAATYPAVGPHFQDVLLAADDALFVAKDRGRNQVRTVAVAEDRTA